MNSMLKLYTYIYIFFFKKCIEAGLVRMSNAGEILQHVLDGKLHGDSRSGVASADQVFKVLVLTDELVLHRVPHHLVEQK